MKAAIIIPSRYSSTRLPGKALADIAGRPLVQWVYEACERVTNASNVLIATDDSRIVNAAKAFNGEVIMTSHLHESGTDRCAEVAKKLEVDYIINVQGDEPFINPLHVSNMISHFQLHPNIDLLTCHHTIDNETELNDPSNVKLVLSTEGKVLYFSRSRIPFPRSSQHHPYLKHVGIYGFRRTKLIELAKLPPSQLEKMEGLEQLRWLENGHTIHSIEIEGSTLGVDTPEDLEKARAFVRNRY